MYQESINLASEELVVANPKLLDDRDELLKLACVKVNDDGYNYKKGKSRSKRFHESSSAVKQVKQTTTPTYVRTQRMLHLEDSLKDIDKQIGFKELRREQAINSRQYQICDEITHEITKLKTQRYQEQIELKSLQHKEQQSKWYKKRKETDEHDDLTKVLLHHLVLVVVLNQPNALPSFFLNQSNESAHQIYQKAQKIIQSKWHCKSQIMITLPL